MAPTQIGRQRAMTPDSIRSYREAICAAYQQIDPKGEADVWLSGGVDSATVLFAAMECGFKPHCITFHVKDVPSPDLEISRKICSCFGLKHSIITIPSDPQSVIADCFRVIDELIDWPSMRDASKRVIQCLHPILYLVPATTSTIAMSGDGGDLLAITARHLSISARYSWDPFCIEERTICHKKYRQQESMVDAFAHKHDVSVGRVFLTDQVMLCGRSIPVKTYNTPRQKWGHVAPFLKYWSKGAFYRKNSPYQIASGLRDMHWRVLSKTEWGSGCANILPIYRRMVASRGISLPGEKTRQLIELQSERAIYRLKPAAISLAVS